MLTAFPLTEIERIVKRTAYASVAAAVVGGAVAVVLGQPLVAVGLVIGVALAIANHRVFQSSAMRFTTPEGVVNRKPFAGSVLLRLGSCTAVAIALLVFERPAGWGAIGGLALFQAMMLANAIVALLGYQRSQAGQAGDTGA